MTKIKIKFLEIHKKNKKVKTLATKINGVGFKVELERDCEFDDRTMKNLLKNELWNILEVEL